MLEEGESILFLGPGDSPLFDWLRAEGEPVWQTAEPISVAIVRERRAGHLVSYGYRHIIGGDVLEAIRHRAVNLHISLLPWNRGADPNLWSFVDGTPSGVTIHFIDAGVDTGDIIAQRELEFDLHKETLATSYTALQAAIQRLFIEHWVAIKDASCTRTPQSGEGSFHRLRDKERIMAALDRGWDTLLIELQGFQQRG